MSVVDVYNLERKKVGTVELNDAVFNVEVREHLFHEVVRNQRAERRAGTAKTKERGEVKGSTAKAWKQKGTGRARQGNRKAAHWRGGGVAHGPRPRDFSGKVNRKIVKAALMAALSRRQQEGCLVVVDSFALPEIKTSQVASVLSTFEVSKGLIVDVKNEALAKSANNLANSSYLAVDGLNVYDVLRHDTLMMTREAIQQLEGRLTQ
jgi:large subunit ribosomal protein L4